MLGQIVGDLVPGGFGSDKDVFSGANAGIRVEQPYRQVAELAVRWNTETGPTDSTEGPGFSRGCFVDGQQLLARQPAKILGVDFCVGRERGSMEPSAHGTVTIAHLMKRTVNFITHPAAKTSAL